MNIVRKIKLEQLGYYKCKDNKEKELFDYIENNMLNLKKIQLIKYPDHIFYFKGNKCIFKHNLILNLLCFRHIDLLFFSKLLFNKQTNNLLNNIAKNITKIENIIVMINDGLNTKQVEKAYKNEYSKKNEIK